MDSIIELTTGYPTFEELDAEIVSVVDDFRAMGVETIHVTFGFGCALDARVQSQDVPVPLGRLIRFIEDAEADGTFQLRESDLILQGGGLEFLFCHEGDVHCYGRESPRLLAVRRRWRREHEQSADRRCGGRYRRLTGRPKAR
ncbi:hypothetical protein [Planctomyces sp. SH-PL62]|uniref:hypothetical protein n=1 Tax=Planctomyces sp. SH-PL62 TaxID=1636152 RepID=UPI00078ECD6D|nr:hypothetical protein [Planctomyces sp. SH-PL62]AMV37432.1 hypothetical protein VT85_08355 [Planctomyces sp. SH-PL62]